ncbi:hypothetical protein L218DRAFT_674048 [Marasmius fiardii PR-910]|nr:hypothetical protein L218DRAFT_674048 [Marasmius fiardii PR-910]
MLFSRTVFGLLIVSLSHIALAAPGQLLTRQDECRQYGWTCDAKYTCCEGWTCTGVPAKGGIVYECL